MSASVATTPNAVGDSAEDTPEHTMSLMAVEYPILPGKTADWHAFMAELNGPRRKEFSDSRRKAGVHERTFLQPTSKGDTVIVTLEGADPAAAFRQMMGARDPFTTWFMDRVMAIHGVDLSTLPTRSPSELVIDSEQAGAARVPAPAG
jgi:hypothetical protein